MIKFNGRGCTCRGCVAPNCDECVNCMDHIRNGGPGTKKQRCINRTCERSTKTPKTPGAPMSSMRHESEIALAQSRFHAIYARANPTAPLLDSYHHSSSMQGNSHHQHVNMVCLPSQYDLQPLSLDAEPRAPVPPPPLFTAITPATQLEAVMSSDQTGQRFAGVVGRYSMYGPTYSRVAGATVRTGGPNEFASFHPQPGSLIGQMLNTPAAPRPQIVTTAAPVAASPSTSDSSEGGATDDVPKD